MPLHRGPERSHPTAEQTLVATAAQAVRLREQLLADLASLDAASFQEAPQHAAGRELLTDLRGAIDGLFQHVERVDEPHAG